MSTYEVCNYLTTGSFSKSLTLSTTALQFLLSKNYLDNALFIQRNKQQYLGKNFQFQNKQITPTQTNLMGINNDKITSLKKKLNFLI